MGNVEESNTDLFKQMRRPERNILNAREQSTHHLERLFIGGLDGCVKCAA